MSDRLFETFLRLILGTAFIMSAILKLYAIGEFELYLYTQPLLSWNLSIIISRLILSIEFAIAILIILNIHTRHITIFTILLLAGFSLFLGILHASGTNDENCFCFGTALQLNTGESIIKNLILLGLAVLLYWKRKESNKCHQLLFIGILIACFLTPLILSPPDFLFKKRYADVDSATEAIAPKLFSEAKMMDDPASIAQQDRVMLCFFSMGCKYCKWAAKRVTAMKTKTDEELKVVYIFYGHPDRLDSFWQESESDVFPYYLVRTSSFFEYSGKSLPTILLIERGKVIERFNYRTLGENKILEFFAND